MSVRTIKSEFWMHSVMAQQRDGVQLLALALLNMADDEGYFNAHPLRVKAQCLPYKDTSADDVQKMMDVLVSAGWIQTKQCDDGEMLGRVINFNKHQNLNEFPTELKKKWFGSEYDEEADMADIRARNDQLRKVRGIVRKSGARGPARRTERKAKQQPKPEASHPRAATGWKAGDPIEGALPRMIDGEVYFMNPREGELRLPLDTFRELYPNQEVI